MSIKSGIKFFARGFKYLLYFPFMIPAIIAYFCLHPQMKTKIKMDIDAFYEIEYHRNRVSDLTAFYRMMVEILAFRNIFYYRLHHFAPLISWILKREHTLAVRPVKLGGGVYIQHGTSTQLDATEIGENFWTNQNVTVGWRGDGCPTIGNNVRIGTGAVVLGKIRIGNNVKIGAGAIVVKDVPDNCTVVSPLAYICKRDGKRVHEEL